jgi:hypothetical protein
MATASVMAGFRFAPRHCRTPARPSRRTTRQRPSGGDHDPAGIRRIGLAQRDAVAEENKNQRSRRRQADTRSPREPASSQKPDEPIELAEPNTASSAYGRASQERPHGDLFGGFSAARLCFPRRSHQVLEEPGSGEHRHHGRRRCDPLCLRSVFGDHRRPASRSGRHDGRRRHFSRRLLLLRVHGAGIHRVAGGGDESCIGIVPVRGDKRMDETRPC